MKTAIRFLGLSIPTILFLFALTIPQSSARLSLILHGYPFARVVSKDQLDIFKYVEIDSFAYRGVVFSGDKPVGLISHPKGTVASFEPFGREFGSPEDMDAHLWFELPLVLLWSVKWWLLAVQAIVVLYWLRAKERRLLAAQKRERLVRAQARLLP